jgi:hypothetical protein
MKEPEEPDSRLRPLSIQSDNVFLLPSVAKTGTDMTIEMTHDGLSSKHRIGH